MIVVDTSVWIEHLRTGKTSLGKELVLGDVWSHPFVVGELACGQLRNRAEILALLRALPQAPVAEHDEVLAFLDRHQLTGIGIGWVDAHLLAATRLLGARLWTLDRALREAARRADVELMALPE
jgi:hypothetical protein